MKIIKNILIINNNIETYCILEKMISKLQNSIKRKEHLTNEIKVKNLKLNSFFLQYQDHIGSEDRSYLLPLIIYLTQDLAKDLKQYRNT